jgi:4-hydroxy-tetrahydrodipicolinate synthase
MAMDRKCQGVIVPVITPFTENGKIDSESVCRITDHLIAGGADGIFALGTTGEGASIPISEKKKMVQAVVDNAKNRILVYAGISSNCLDESIAIAEHFLDLGTDVLVAHVPSYFPLQEEEIFSYFVKLADRTAGPLMLYNIPATTRLSLSIDVTDKLSRHERIIGLKDSENTPGRLEAAIERFSGRSDFSYVVGCASLSAQGVALGAAGIVPSCANLYPRLYKALFECAQKGSMPDAEKLQEQTDHISLLYQRNRSLGQSIAALKAAMHSLGFCKPVVLPPLETLQKEDIARMQKQMATMTFS